MPGRSNDCDNSLTSGSVSGSPLICLTPLPTRQGPPALPLAGRIQNPPMPAHPLASRITQPSQKPCRPLADRIPNPPSPARPLASRISLSDQRQSRALNSHSARDTAHAVANVDWRVRRHRRRGRGRGNNPNSQQHHHQQQQQTAVQVHHRASPKIYPQHRKIVAQRVAESHANVFARVEEALSGIVEVIQLLQQNFQTIGNVQTQDENAPCENVPNQNSENNQKSNIKAEKKRRDRARRKERTRKEKKRKVEEQASNNRVQVLLKNNLEFSKTGSGSGSVESWTLRLELAGLQTAGPKMPAETQDRIEQLRVLIRDVEHRDLATFGCQEVFHDLVCAAEQRAAEQQVMVERLAADERRAAEAHRTAEHQSIVQRRIAGNHTGVERRNPHPQLLDAAEPQSPENAMSPVPGPQNSLVRTGAPRLTSQQKAAYVQHLQLEYEQYKQDLHDLSDLLPPIRTPIQDERIQILKGAIRYYQDTLISLGVMREEDQDHSLYHIYY